MAIKKNKKFPLSEKESPTPPSQKKPRLIASQKRCTHHISGNTAVNMERYN